MEKAATLSIINSRLARNTEGNAVINMANATSMNLQGNLLVKDNKVVGCNESNNQGVIAAINMSNKPMIVGTGSITVKDNTSDGDEATHANHHMFGIYSTIADDSTPIMSQIANTKHSNNTYIDSIAFAKDNGYGHIINNWTKDTAEDVNSYKTSILADKFVHDDLTTSVYKNNLVIRNYDESDETYKVVFVSTVSDAVVEAAIATQNVAYKGTASEPKVSYEGYEFIGWFTDTTYTTKFDFINTLITQDTTIYAKWVSNKYIVKRNH